MSVQAERVKLKSLLFLFLYRDVIVKLNYNSDIFVVPQCATAHSTKVF